MNWLSGWQLFALGSALFAALTAFLGKIGVGNINSNLATFIRTVVILIFTAGLLSVRGGWARPETIPAKTWIFLIASGIATGLSWLCYYRALQLGPVSRVAAIDKLSVVFAIFLGIIFLNEQFTWKIALGGTLIVLGALMMLL